MRSPSPRSEPALAARPGSPLPTRWFATVLLVLLLFPVVSGCDSSRPGIARNPIARHHSRLEGRRIVEAACEAHGGYEIWKHKQDVTFELVDRWRGMAGRFVRPWPGENASGHFRAQLRKGYGSVEITGERGRLTYGIGPQGAWAMIGEQMSQDQDDIDTAETVIPNYLFFFQMPFSFLSYEAVHHYLGV